MPKDYQISQYDEPINVNGRLALPDGTLVGVERAHLEEDTGKSTHVGSTGRIHGADRSLVDYNRAGVPLVEIVSAPDLRSSAQARAYVAELRGILVATGASDGRMEEGSLRIDANVSVRAPGAPLGTRCEIKNLNSLRSLQRAVDHEAERQARLLADGGVVVQETRHWDEGAGRTVTMRSKEEAYDYRYFPEPDLVPLAPDDAWRDRVAAALGPMPARAAPTLVALLERRRRRSQLDQVAAVVDVGLDGFVVAAAARGVAAQLALARIANELAAIDGAAHLDAAAGGHGARDGAARRALRDPGQGGARRPRGDRRGPPRARARRAGSSGSTTPSLDGLLDELIAAHPDEWARYRDGRREARAVLRRPGHARDQRQGGRQGRRRGARPTALSGARPPPARLQARRDLHPRGPVRRERRGRRRPPRRARLARRARRSPGRSRAPLVVADLPVVRCPTSYGIPPSRDVDLPARVGAQVTRSARTDALGVHRRARHPRRRRAPGVGLHGARRGRRLEQARRVPARATRAPPGAT